MPPRIRRPPLPRRAGLLPLLAVLACGGDGDPAPEVAALAPLAVVEVETAAVSRGPISQVLSAPGSLVALRESRIGAEVGGRILRVFADEGDRLEAGDPLFQIDPEPYEAALRQARAGVDLARAERGQMEADLRRARSLRQKEIVATQEIDRLQTALAVAHARERQAVEGVALAELQLARTLVAAPYASTVAARLADEGTTALVQPQTIVFVLQETHELEGRATIPEAHLAAVQKGDPARLSVEGFPEPIETEISAVGDAVDPATRTYEVRMRVPNPDHRFKAGVFAHVEIRPRPKPDALLVPRAALRTEEGRTRVLVVREGRAEAVPVQLGIVGPERVEVQAGLAEGDRVIVGEAARSVAPGMRVRVAGAPGGDS
jgi:RND family efflux transporter MFP subunit